MIISFGLCILFGLFWLIFFTSRSFINVILSWILFHLVKRIVPHGNLQITVENFGYFCVNGVGVHINENCVVRIEKISLQLLWEDFRLRLQSVVEEITLETNPSGKFTEENKKYKKQDQLAIKASLTVGINLYSLHPPTELLRIATETEHAHGLDIKTSELSTVWLFARNAKASIQDRLDDSDSCEISISGGDALVLYNSYTARLVFLFKNASATFLPNTDEVTSVQIAKSEGLMLVYNFDDGILTSSHSRLKHTEINLSALTLNNLGNLMSRCVKAHFDYSPQKEKILENGKDSRKNSESSSEIATEEKCEMAIEAESVTLKVYPVETSKHFELKWAFICLGRPDINMMQWSVSIPFELTFIDELSGREKELVLGSTLKSDDVFNPCVLKIEGEEISNKATRWTISSNEGILMEIKPKYVNTVEYFIKTYESITFKENPNSSIDVLEHGNIVVQADDVMDDQDRVELNESLQNHQGMCEISATISDISIEVKDKLDENLLQVSMIHPKLSLLQEEETRSFSFVIETLEGFNCVENMPFFHPTKDSRNEQEKTASLELSIVEKVSNDSNKVSFKKFSFGSCDTTVIAEETLIFAVLKDFGLHKKVAQIFFENREKQTGDESSRFSQRFHFDHIELRDVEVILSLLPAIDLPVDLRVIKNNLGIPHQLPPRVENACLYFDAFVRKNIQYGSYKYISYDIKKHYLKELGSQSARVLGSMHLFGNISRLKQDIMSGFTTLRETGEFITFFHQVTTGVASSYSKFTGSWSDLFGLNSQSRTSQESLPSHERRHSDPSDFDVTVLRQFSGEFDQHYQVNSTTNGKSKDDCGVVDEGQDSESIWLQTSLVPDVTNETDGLNWDTESSDGEANLGFPLDLIPRNVKRQLKGQEFLRRLKENLGDNEHGEVFSCCFKVRRNVAETKLNALLSNRKVYFLKGRPSHESLVLCVKYDTLYKAQYLFQAKTHYIQLMNKMKGIKTLSIPSRNPGECPLVRCDNMVIGRKVSIKINELKRTYDHEYMHSQHQ